MITKFRTRVIEVEGILCSDVMRLAEKDWDALPWWILEAYDKGDLFMTHEYIGITNPETRLMDEALRSDWIIRSSTGYIRPALQSEVEHLYEVV